MNTNYQKALEAVCKLNYGEWKSLRKEIEDRFAVKVEPIFEEFKAKCDELTTE